MRLIRYAYTTSATLGVLEVGALELCTIERPWRGNAPWVSCIPTGSYQMTSGRFRDTYPALRLVDVPGRTAIWIHRANRAAELQGCIAVGTDPAERDLAVLNSGAALETLVRAAQDQRDYVLEIRNDLGRFAAPDAWAPPPELAASHKRLREAELELERVRADLRAALTRG